MLKHQLIHRVVTLVTVFFASTALAMPAAAQDATPAVPFADSPPPDIITQLPADARAASCNAFQLPNFAPHVVRPGDTLPLLLAGSTALTVTQAAALNCLDDPYTLPVGAVIFLPARSGERETAGEAGEEAAAIVAFAAESNEVRNTEGVSFAWSGTGDAAYFFPCPVDERAGCSRPAMAASLPVDGSATVDSFTYAGDYRYALEIVGAGDPVLETVTVSVRCAQSWLGDQGAFPLCPEEPPRAVFAAWQPFEHGAMLWFSDTAQIYALSDDGTFRIYGDTYVEGMPESPLSPPEGLIAPVRGFRRVWDALGGEEGLGWATASELGFDSARQPAGRLSYTTYVLAANEDVYAITELPDAEVGYWSIVSE